MALLPTSPNGNEVPSPRQNQTEDRHTKTAENRRL
jgi:hypothetical protein